MTTLAPHRPVMRYHGGKWMLAPWIIRNMPRHRVYVEPYGGAGSVLLRKPRAFAEVYNDLDGEVVNVFRVLRDPVTAEALRRAVVLTPFARVEFLKAYEPCEDPVERARRMIVRGFMSFGTTSRRANRTGFRARAWRDNATGAADWKNWPDVVPAMVNRLRGIVIESRPALEIIAQQDSPDTLFYVDPPYPQSTRSSIRWPSEMDRAYLHDMTDQDHRELAAALAGVKGAVMLSTYESDLYDELYPKATWARSYRKALADGGRAREEVLLLNPLAVTKPMLFDAQR